MIIIVSCESVGLAWTPSLLYPTPTYDFVAAESLENHKNLKICKLLANLL